MVAEIIIPAIVEDKIRTLYLSLYIHYIAAAG